MSLWRPSDIASFNIHWSTQENKNISTAVPEVCTKTRAKNETTHCTYRYVQCPYQLLLCLHQACWVCSTYYWVLYMTTSYTVHTTAYTVFSSAYTVSTVSLAGLLLAGKVGSISILWVRRHPIISHHVVRVSHVHRECRTDGNQADIIPSTPQKLRTYFFW